MSALVPTVAALAGACVFGVTAVLQQHATHRVVTDPRNQPAFVWGLVRQRLWLASTVGSVGGFALQALALATGPIVLVQPLLVTGVLFAAATGFLLGRSTVDWGLVAGLVMTSGGLALFLVAARPSAGEETLTVGDAIPLAAVLAVLVVGCLWQATRQRGAARSMALALATGIVYGVTAAVAKVTLGMLDEGPVTVLTHWSMWTVIVLGPFGFLLNQHAFRESALASPVVAVITVTDPLVGIGIGIMWLGESVHAEGPAVLAEVLGLLAMAAGVWLVTHRAPHLSGEDGSTASAATTKASHNNVTRHQSAASSRRVGADQLRKGGS
jgi:drug/metabolite transporter (DMT)-like permease